MEQERTDLVSKEEELVSREELVRAIGPNDPANRAALEAVSTIEKALKGRNRGVEFTIFCHKPPFFTSELARGGMEGLKADIAFLEEVEGDYVYRERVLGLRFKIGDVENVGDFFKAIEAQEVGPIRGRFDEALEEPGIITLKKVKISSWEKN